MFMTPSSLPKSTTVVPHDKFAARTWAFSLAYLERVAKIRAQNGVEFVETEMFSLEYWEDIEECSL